MKKISVMLIVSMLLFFSACESAEDYIIPLGTYAVEAVEGEGMPLELELSDGKTFSFCNLLLSSNPSKGKYKIRDKVLHLETNENNIYCFNIDGETLTFNSELSEISAEEPAFSSLENGVALAKVPPDRCRIDHNLADSMKD